jgi:hypothetical protein
MTYFIVYDDLSVFESGNGTKPPGRRVQVIVQPHPDVGMHTQSQHDFYIRRDGRWVGVDRAGLFEDMEENGVARFNIGYRHQVLSDGEWVEVDEFGLYHWLEETGYALFGRTMTSKAFNEAMRVALSIRDVERAKVGWLANEKQPVAD